MSREVKLTIPDGKLCNGCPFLGRVHGYRSEEEYGPAPSATWKCRHYGVVLETTGLYGGDPEKCPQCIFDDMEKPG